MILRDVHLFNQWNSFWLNISHLFYSLLVALVTFTLLLLLRVGFSKKTVCILPLLLLNLSILQVVLPKLYAAYLPTTWVCFNASSLTSYFLLTSTRAQTLLVLLFLRKRLSDTRRYKLEKILHRIQHIIVGCFIMYMLHLEFSKSLWSISPLFFLSFSFPPTPRSLLLNIPTPTISLSLSRHASPYSLFSPFPCPFLSFVFVPPLPRLPSSCCSSVIFHFTHYLSSRLSHHLCLLTSILFKSCRGTEDVL